MRVSPSCSATTRQKGVRRRSSMSCASSNESKWLCHVWVKTEYSSSSQTSSTLKVSGPSDDAVNSQSVRATGMLRCRSYFSRASSQRVGSTTFFHTISVVGSGDASSGASSRIATTEAAQPNSSRNTSGAAMRARNSEVATMTRVASRRSTGFSSCKKPPLASVRSQRLGSSISGFRDFT